MSKATTSLELLDLSMESLAMEVSFGESINTIRLFFPKLLERFQNYVIANRVNDKETIVYTKDQKFLLKELPHIKYVDFKDLKVPGPEGFIGELLPYGKYLEESIQYGEALDTRVLFKLSGLLSAILTNKNSALSLKSESVMVAKMTKDRDHLNSLAGGYFTTDHNTAIVPISQLLKRAADIPTLLSATNNITRRANAVNYTIINAEIDKICMLINELIDSVSKGDVEKISKPVMHDLVNFVYNAAREAEFLSITHYRVLGYVKCVDNLNGKLNDHIKNLSN